MKSRFPIPLHPLAFSAIFNVFHIGNVMNVIALPIHATERFGATDLQIGLLGGIQLSAYGLFAWAGGKLSDRSHRRTLIVLGLLMLSAGSAAIPRMDSVAALIAAGAFCSLVQVFVFPAYWGWLAESAEPENLSRVLGVNGVMLVFCGMIAAFSAGRLYGSLGPDAPFLTAMACALASALFACFFIPRPAAEPLDLDPEEGSRTMMPGPSPAMSAKFLWAGLGLNALGFFVAITHQSFLVRFAKLDRYDISLDAQSNIHTMRMLCGLGGYALGAFWRGWRWRWWPFWAAGAWFGGLTAAAYFSSGTWGLGAALALGGFATSFGNQAALYYCVNGSVMKRGSGAGLNESVLALGGAAGPFAAGLAATAAGTARAALLVPFIPLSICAALWFYLARARPVGRRAS